MPPIRPMRTGRVPPTAIPRVPRPGAGVRLSRLRYSLNPEAEYSELTTGTADTVLDTGGADKVLHDSESAVSLNRTHEQSISSGEPGPKN